MAKKNTTSKSGRASDKKSSGATVRRTAVSKKLADAARTSRKGIPTNEEISQKAHEIYLDRISKGEPGNPDSDWQQALDFFKLNSIWIYLVTILI